MIKIQINLWTIVSLAIVLGAWAVAHRQQERKNTPRVRPSLKRCSARASCVCDPC